MIQKFIQLIKNILAKNKQSNFMILPKCGRVIVVDDTYAEALPLIKALSKNGISSLYFSGDNEELPDKVIDDVELIFLDLELQETTGQRDPKTHASNVANKLCKLVGEGSKYIIVAWTKHQEALEQLETYLATKNIKPITIVDLEKNECIDPQNGNEIDLSVIEESINNKLSDLKIFKLFILWRNLVQKSASEIVNDFAGLSQDENWDEDTSKLFYELAKAYSGEKNIDINNLDEVIKNSLLTFNGIFLEKLEKNILSDNFNSANVTFVNGERNFGGDFKAEINTRLLTINAYDDVVRPGNIYEQKISKDKLTDLIKNDYAKTGKESIFVENDVKCISLEISPLCDYSNGKWNVHRVLNGILCPEEACGVIDNSRFKGGYLYKPGYVLRYEGKNWELVFNKRQLVTKELGRFASGKPMLVLNRSFLVDIQHKVAGHISRPGVTSV